jgi:hypothetical protein
LGRRFISLLIVSLAVIGETVVVMTPTATTRMRKTDGRSIGESRL